MTSLLAFVIACLAALIAPATPARAQSIDNGTFLTPFPDGDRYRVMVIGDSMAQGMLDALDELMAQDPKFQISKERFSLNNLIRADIDDAATSLHTRLKAAPSHIAVVMLGADDRSALRVAGKRHGVGSEEWKAEYARRLDMIMRELRQQKVGVFWLGLPVMRRDDANNDALMLNEVLRSRALANGVRFVDVFANFADADKNYSSHGPDLDGKTRLLRESDGVYFTWYGSRKLAYFVERELKRAAQQAWDERTIPLAGAEPEQARIRPIPTVKLAPLPPRLAGGRGPAGTQSAQAGKRPAAVAGAGSGPGGIEAQNGQVTIRDTGAQGKPGMLAIEILRPAIPAAVVQLVTRRESADKASALGDTVMTEILGGVTVVSSVTATIDTSGGRRREASAASSPMRSVLLRGEMLPPKAGRSDDMPWPRPEPDIVRADYKPTGSVAASTALGGIAGEPPLPRRPSWAGARRR